MPVGVMLRSMSSSEFAEWSEFYRMEPFGEVRADLRSAIVATTLANIHRKKGRRAFSVGDFMPKFEAEEATEEQTPGEMLQIVETLNQTLGGKDLRGKKGKSRGR